MKIKLLQKHIAVIERAKIKSIADKCTVHVNIHMTMNKTTFELFIEGLGLSDWFIDGSTLTSFTEGREH